MKLKKGYTLQKDGKEYILVADGSVSDVGEVIVYSNSTAYFILELLNKEDEDITKDKIIQAIIDEYDVEKNIVEKDVEHFIEHLNQNGLIDL